MTIFLAKCGYFDVLIIVYVAGTYGTTIDSSLLFGSCY